MPKTVDFGMFWPGVRSLVAHEYFWLRDRWWILHQWVAFAFPALGPASYRRQDPRDVQPATGPHENGGPTVCRYWVCSPVIQNLNSSIPAIPVGRLRIAFDVGWSLTSSSELGFALTCLCLRRQPSFGTPGYPDRLRSPAVKYLPHWM